MVFMLVLKGPCGIKHGRVTIELAAGFGRRVSPSMICDPGWPGIAASERGRCKVRQGAQTVRPLAPPDVYFVKDM